MIQSGSLSLVREAVDTFPANMAILEADGTIVHVNERWRAFAKAGGIADSEPMEGIDYLAAVDADDSQSAVEAGEGIRAVLDGEVDSYEQVYPCHSPDEKRWFRMIVSGFVSDGDRYAAVVHVDITDRTKREHELELFESTFANQIGIGIMVDDRGEIVVANDRFYEITDTAPAEMEGQHYDALETVLPTDGGFDQIASMLAQVLDGRLDVASTEVEFLFSDDSMTADLRIIPADVDEYTRGAILSARDVTDWKQREDRLRQYERAVESSTEMLSAVDADYRFLFANRAYREFHGLEGADITDLSLRDVLEEGTYEPTVAEVDRVLAGERIERTAEREGPDGNVHPLGVRYFPLRAVDGSIAGAVAAMRDLTEQRNRERQLLVLDRVLRHNMANEMNIVQGYAELLMDHDDPEVAGYAEKIVSTSERLVNSVDKEREIVTLLSKSSEMTRIDLVALVGRVVATCRLEHPDAEIRVEAPDRIPVRTISQIERAIDELIQNAIVHTDAPDPTVDVTVAESAADECVRVRVADRGPGIPPTERDVLTGEAEIGPLYHGSGMGLWMVNWIVDRVGGTLSFESREPRGSVVTIDIPRRGTDS